MLAVVAAVVGRQGVHLGDAGHGGHEADEPTRAAASPPDSRRDRDLLDQLDWAMDVQRGEAVAARWSPAPCPAAPGRSPAGDRRTAPCARPPGAVLDVVLRVRPRRAGRCPCPRDAWGTGEASPRGSAISVGVVDHDLMALLRAQIGELVQHFLGGAGSTEAADCRSPQSPWPAMSDGAVDGVLRVLESGRRRSPRPACPAFRPAPRCGG